MQSFSRPESPPPPSLLILEIWGLGDLALAVPFIRAAAAQGDVTLVARPRWVPLIDRFCPGVGVVRFEAPWTAFSGKYRLWSWPWGRLRSLVRDLRARRFTAGVSARWDPRDHLLLRFAGAGRRIGFPRAGSGILLTEPLADGRTLHRAKAWERIAARLGLRIAPPAGVRDRPVGACAPLVLHSGAGRPTRVWPLDRCAGLVRLLRGAGRTVRVLCDPPQLDEWRRLGEPGASAPDSLDAMFDSLADAAGFIGNDSGPGHVAALCGVPTFTIFGPQLPALFAPRHPGAAWIEGAPCPHRPCFDSCRFAEPSCIRTLPLDDVWAGVRQWLRRMADVEAG